MHLIERLMREQGSKHFWGYVLAFGMMGVIATTTTLSAYMMKYIVDRIFVDRNIEAMWAIGGAITVIYIAKGFATYGQQVILSRIANNIIAESQAKIFDKMLAMDVSFYNARHSTEFLARQAFISQSAGSALNTLVTAFGRDVLTTLGLTFAMFQQDAVLASVAILIMPLAIVGVRKLGNRARRVIMTEFYGFAAILESLQETAQGIRVVKSFTLEPFMRERQVAAIRSFETAANKLTRVQSRSSPLMETLAGVAVAMVVVYGGYRVINSGAQPGNFFAFITAMLLATEPAKRVARLHVDISTSLLGVEMLYQFLDEKTPETEPDDMPALQITAGRVEFDNVEFSYRPGEMVLNKLSLVAAPGETTALVGRSGGGKTTAMSMILRFYEPTAGRILIDGQEIAAFSRRSLRSQIAYVGQDTFLFKGSIRQNIAFGKPGASDEEIIAASRAAFAHDFIMSFENGYNSPVGEQGMQLSGGQRQRISIARAFLKDAPLILLDEATSALDTESERAVQEALKTLCAGRTTIVIAHRLSTIANAERICVIEGGRVVETGRQDELLAREGIYALLHKTQFDRGLMLASSGAAAE
ncbi:ABC transporter ATP-binding protein/permease [Rhodoblastus acidophilus]|uniref:ABC transporter ATP-binding protein/permease n=1 Tax=Candidatus Rhodoblastus alkanivorans TaxID=2954117 RepID=A0ABS9Z5V8_9HYPH|nr:ABC transporter ATP-binding protein [Candidatus Rhodoblastus alkanivorans]MCI4678604.1 ABC transporter ATP-binding protein/permease [Candidatus Rhodoblastus alkanivorans]MCI4683014.1 ABC transporter ATP-binding protein/permease [Candidatus Rhodoblastus alkanivorans]MDI4640324.1 ABC transporter ATP-binding protein/permease [Rhodoblastus acidophilus]